MEPINNFHAICMYINEVVGYELAAMVGTTLTFDNNQPVSPNTITVKTQVMNSPEVKIDTIYDQVVIQNIINMIWNEDEEELWMS